MSVIPRKVSIRSSATSRKRTRDDCLLSLHDEIILATQNGRVDQVDKILDKIDDQDWISEVLIIVSGKSHFSRILKNHGFISIFPSSKALFTAISIDQEEIVAVLRHRLKLL